MKEKRWKFEYINESITVINNEDKIHATGYYKLTYKDKLCGVITYSMLRDLVDKSEHHGLSSFIENLLNICTDIEESTNKFRKLKNG